MAHRDIRDSAISEIARMDVVELKDFISSLVENDLEAAIAVNRRVQYERKHLVFTYGLRRNLSDLILDAPKPSDDPDVEDRSWMVRMFDGIPDSDLEGMEEFRESVESEVKCAVENAFSYSSLYDAEESIKTAMRMLGDSDNPKVRAVGTEMEIEYFPEVMKRVYDKGDDSTKDRLTRWAMEKVCPMPNMYEFQNFCEHFIYDQLDDTRHYRVMRSVLVERMKKSKEAALADGEEPYFDSWTFGEACRCMMEIKDWKGIEKLCTEYSGKDDVHKVLGDMYSMRRRYDDALIEYIACYAALKNVREKEEIVQKVCANEKRYVGSAEFKAFLEKAVFEDDIDLLNPYRILYRHTAEDEKPLMKSRMMERMDWDDLKLARVFGTDKDVVDVYKGDFFDDCNNMIILSNLYQDYLSFAGSKRNIDLFVSMFYDIITEYEGHIGYDNSRLGSWIARGFNLIAKEMGAYGQEKALEAYTDFEGKSDLAEEVFENLVNEEWFAEDIPID